MDIDQSLNDLEQAITKLKLDFDRYFGGGEKTSPERARDRLAGFVKQLGAVQMQTSGQRFRYQTLVSRFYTYNELWNKLLRAKEEGTSLVAVSARLPRHRGAAPAPEKPAPERPAAVRPAAPPPDPDRCVFSSGLDNQQVAKFFDRFVELRTGTGEGAGKLSLQSFQKLVQSQIQQISKKHGSETVEFRLTVKDGKVQMSAKPVAGK